MKKINVLFFGSTTDSVVVLDKLFSVHNEKLTINCVGVVTQPPKPVGRKQILTPTPVEVWAKAKNIPVYSFPNDPQKSWLYQNEVKVIQTLAPLDPQLLISASYGQKIPTTLIQNTQFGGLNIHPSLLPRWRGADPVPWAIIAGDPEIGVTLVTLAEKFDQGKIIAQQKIPLLPYEFADPIRSKLFSLGSDLLLQSLPHYISNSIKPITTNLKPITSFPYARKFTREDGYIPWELFQNAMEGNSLTKEQRASSQTSSQGRLNQLTILNKFDDQLKNRFINHPISTILERLFYALTPWPGIWTNIPALRIKDQESGNGKRVKIIRLHTENERLVLDEVQLEGKKPAPFRQFQDVYLKLSE